MLQNKKFPKGSHSVFVVAFVLTFLGSFFFVIKQVQQYKNKKKEVVTKILQKKGQQA